MSKKNATAVNSEVEATPSVNESLAKILGINVEALTPEQIKEAKKILVAATRGEGKTNAIETLIQTARNHRAKLENNFFDLKKMGASEEVLAELMQPLEFKQCKTRTQARLKKEAAAAQEAASEEKAE